MTALFTCPDASGLLAPCRASNICVIFLLSITIGLPQRRQHNACAQNMHNKNIDAFFTSPHSLSSLLSSGKEDQSVAHMLLAPAFTGPLTLHSLGEELFPSNGFTEDLKNVLFNSESLSDWVDPLHFTCHGTEYQRVASGLHFLEDLRLLLQVQASRVSKGWYFSQ